MTVPNFITTIRIILAPIFIIYVINDQMKSALTVFALCCVTDGLDGMVARLFKQKSKLGAYLDPIADKILLVATFVALSVRGLLPPWLTVTVIARDVLILMGISILFLIRLEFMTIKPSIISKCTTCLQFASVIAVLARGHLFSMPAAVYPSLYYLTALLTISSGLHYMHYWFKMMGEGAVADRES